ncbi:MAG: hypothetical protein ACI3VZ_06500 [Faecousia sp.]
MKTKRILSLLLVLSLLAALLAGCSSQIVVSGDPTNPSAPAPTGGQGNTEPGAVPVKTGLSVITSVSGSKSATADGDGKAQAEITLVAVTVDDNGVIDHCVIDMIQAKIGFSAEGVLTTDTATTFAGKNELGDDYGMKKASSIGAEWYEQAAAMAAYVEGKTLDEVKNIAVDESGKATDADLAASVTLSVGNFLTGIEDAVNNAAHLGAQKGDVLKLTSFTTMSKSKDAGADGDGQAQAYANVAALTLNGETITSCSINAVQATVKFDTTGTITSDTTAAVASKNELGDEYGMKKASSIGAEWYEQAAAFGAYVTGKTLTEAGAIAVDESGKAADADLLASCTVGIGDFLELIAKAAA